jgi:hypothetical protein
MHTTRFITADEVHLIKTLFSKDKRSVRVELTDEQLDKKIAILKERIQKGITHISMVFDENDSPLCMYVGFELPRIGGWYIGLTKVLESTNHFSKTAPMMVPALELMISKMESKGYFKFWMTAPESLHNIRNKIIKKHSPMANRYFWVDESVAPRGQLTNIEAFDIFRDVCEWSDVVVRMFVLKQEHRVEILKGQNYTDYRGTVIDT